MEVIKHDNQNDIYCIAEFGPTIYLNGPDRDGFYSAHAWMDDVEHTGLSRDPGAALEFLFQDLGKTLRKTTNAEFPRELDTPYGG